MLAHGDETWLSGISLPLSPLQNDAHSRFGQVEHEAINRLAVLAAGARCRRCLLKGCESRFRPAHPLSRYCSRICSAKARCWAFRRANERYRRSEQGKQRRRTQACRYRERQRLKAASAEESAPPETSREGYHPPGDGGKSGCHRPGCYETFTLSPRSPLRRFCSCGCRLALRRVLIRERRWRQRYGISEQVVDRREDSG